MPITDSLETMVNNSPLIFFFCTKPTILVADDAGELIRLVETSFSGNLATSFSFFIASVDIQMTN